MKPATDSSVPAAIRPYAKPILVPNTVERDTALRAASPQ